MAFRLDDTQIETVDDAIAEILRRKTPAERIAMIGEANRTMRRVIAAQVQHTHPEWDARAIVAEVARRMSDGTA